jgi:hypothetical protein
MDTNKKNYYDRSGSSWDEAEDVQLRKEYIDYGEDIIQIGIAHKRTPGGIAYRLKLQRIIPSHTDSRGYFEYVKSDLYKDVVKEGNATRSHRKKAETESSSLVCDRAVTTLMSPRTVTTTLDISDIYKELASLRNDVTLLKVTVLEMINSKIPGSKPEELPMHKRLLKKFRKEKMVNIIE